jgi:predicted RNA-binding protein associated with RNAse of E/G family
MQKPKMLRKRFEPLELVDISEDKLVYRDDELLVTHWNPIRPREDIKYGISFTFLKEGYKVSEIYGFDDAFKHWYCDIIDVEYDETNNAFTFVDLLLDVVISKDKCFEILDIDEVADLLEQKRITDREVILGMRRLSHLLEKIKKDEFLPKNHQAIKEKLNVNHAFSSE